MAAKKLNHVGRTYDVTVAGGKVNVDLKLHQIGDVTGDGSVNVGDVSAIYAHIKGTKKLY